MKLKFLIGVLALLIAVGVQAQDKPKDSPKQDTKVEETKPVPDTWIAGYNDVLALEKVITKIRQDDGVDALEKLFQEKLTALKALIPPGYNFDPETKKFVLNKTTPPAPVGK